MKGSKGILLKAFDEYYSNSLINKKEKKLDNLFLFP